MLVRAILTSLPAFSQVRGLSRPERAAGVDVCWSLPARAAMDMHCIVMHPRSGVHSVGRAG